jgi:hypothetical protein
MLHDVVRVVVSYCYYRALYWWGHAPFVLPRRTLAAAGVLNGLCLVS